MLVIANKILDRNNSGQLILVEREKSRWHLLLFWVNTYSWSAESIIIDMLKYMFSNNQKIIYSVWLIYNIYIGKIFTVIILINAHINI